MGHCKTGTEIRCSKESEKVIATYADLVLTCVPGMSKATYILITLQLCEQGYREKKDKLKTEKDEVHCQGYPKGSGGRGQILP